MQPLVLPPAVIELAFSPVVTIGDWSVRLETLGVAAAVFAALVLGALIARRTAIDPGRPPAAPGPEPGEPNHLRPDDLLYIAIAVLPGAVVGGRFGYLLLHAAYFGAHPEAMFDIDGGGLQLSLGLVGGILTATAVARLLGAPLGRWLGALVLPMLLLLGAGKAAMVLGGSGQGQLSDLAWATAYVSPGAWGSLGPALPSHPAQIYEALATAVVALVVLAVLVSGTFRARPGGVFLLGIGLWAIARAIVAVTWRDPLVFGPLRMDQVISLVIAAGALGLAITPAVVSRVRGGRRQADNSGRPGSAEGAPSSDEAQWPDPATRPRI